MVVCPKCGNNLQARQVFVLSNLSTITCSTCSSRLKVENNYVNRYIGGVGGGVGAALILLLLLSFHITGSLVYLVLLVPLLLLNLIIVYLVVDKYVKVKVVATVQ